MKHAKKCFLGMYIDMVLVAFQFFFCDCSSQKKTNKLKIKLRISQLCNPADKHTSVYTTFAKCLETIPFLYKTIYIYNLHT